MSRILHKKIVYTWWQLEKASLGLGWRWGSAVGLTKGKEVYKKACKIWY